MAGLILLAIITGCGSVGSSKNSTGNTSDNPDGVSVSVKWTVSDYVFGKVSAWGKQDADALLFKSLDITETEINFDGRSCSDVNFAEETVKPEEYLITVWKITPQELSIDSPELQVIKTNCGIPGFNEYMRLGTGRLIVPIKGVFFFFDPLVAY